MNERRLISNALVIALLLALPSVFGATVTRGPYLQTGTTTSVIVRWRTDVATDSRVQYGTTQGSLTQSASNATSTTEHIVTVSGLSANTKYYYSIGTTTQVLAGNDVNHFFITSPTSAKPTRIWVLGDCGDAGPTGTSVNQTAVKNAYYTYTGARHTDLWLMLGDNAYNSGTDAEYQNAVFNMYPEMLRKSVLWSCIGNHETNQATTPSPPASYPYFDIFSFPTAGEAGGTASGTESYYSFNYGNIHFIVLDSMTSSRSATGPMATWLTTDLAGTTKDWTIAIWHHPPYTKGSHNSDTETELIEMRQNILPILENGGVDLVLCGHSHSYERSYFIDGHYGLSSTFNDTYKKDLGDGHPDGGGAYDKAALGPSSHNGTVYTVAGSSGKISGGSLNHAAMLISLNVCGSVVLDVDNGRLDAKFLDNNGSIRDYYTVLKGANDTQGPSAPLSLSVSSKNDVSVSLTWSASTDNYGIGGYKIYRGGVLVGTATTTSFTDSGLTPSTVYSYTVKAQDVSGNLSSASNTVSVTTDPPSSPQPVTLIAAPAMWKYLDNGTDQGTAWTAIAFNDSSWASGLSELGYGDGDEATVVGFGGNASNKYVTTYFRNAFSISNAASFTSLTMRVKRDDGVVVYLNGTEVFRHNMPTGTITYTTLASAAIDDETFYQSNPSTTLLVNGTNVIAAEIHQAAITSSDISFNLSLTGTIAGAPTAFTWAGGTSTWHLSSNWNTGTVPPSNTLTQLTFPQIGASAYTATNNLTETFTLNKMTLSSALAGNTVAGNALSFSGATPMITQSGSGSFTISNAFALGASTVLNGSGTGTVQLNGVVSGTNNIDKQGTSAFTLGGANTYTGSTTVSGGTLLVTGSLAATAGTTSVLSGGTLRGYGNGSTTGLVRAVTVAAGGTVWPGTTPNTSDAKGILTATSADFGSSGGTLRIRGYNTAVDTAAACDSLLLTGATAPLVLGGASKLDLYLTLVSGTYNNRDTVIVDTTAGNLITAPFGSVSIVNNPAALGVSIIYKNATGTIVTPSAGTPAKQVVLRLNASVTPVRLVSLTSHVEGGGVLVEWTCASEFQNIGFDLWRRRFGHGDSAWQKINRELIPARLFSHDTTQYSFFDFEPDGACEYRLDSVSMSGTRESFQKVTPPIDMRSESEVSLEGIAAAIDSALAEVRHVRAEKLTVEFDTLKEAAVSAPADVRFTSGKVSRLKTSDHNFANTTSTSTPIQDSPTSVLQPLIKSNARVGSREAHSIEKMPEQLVKMTSTGSGVLLIPQDALPEGYPATNVSISRGGHCIKALSADANGLALFAPGYADDYTDRDAFFLRPITQPTNASVPAVAQNLFNQPALNSTSDTVTASFHDVYFDWALRAYNFEPWFSSQYLTSGSIQQFTINLPQALPEPGVLNVNVWSFLEDHVLRASINGVPIGETAWDIEDEALTVSFDIPPGVLTAGANTIELLTPDLGYSQLAMVHSISVTHARTLIGDSALTVNATRAGDIYEVSGLTQSGIWVVDPRDPNNPELLPVETRFNPDGSTSARFTATNPGKFLVVPAGSELAPLSVQLKTLRPVQDGIDYIAVGPSQFGAAIEPLLNARRAEGLRAIYLDQDELFDWYGAGRYGPEGIRNALRGLHPRFALMLGRTHYDYRNYSGANLDPLCPAFLVPTTFMSQTISDVPYADFGGGYPKICIGRFPANTPQDLAAMVQRTLAYPGVPISGQRGMLAADKPDPVAGDFAQESESIANASPEIAWARAYLGVTHATSADVTDALRQAASGASDIVLYAGHGNSRVLGVNEPRILDLNSVQSWTGNVVLLQATCNGNWIARTEPGYRSIATQALIQPQGGIAASISTTTYMYSPAATEFMSELLRRPTNENTRWGEVLLQTQQWALQKALSGESSYYTDLGWTETLLGDPALRIHSRIAPPDDGATPPQTKPMVVTHIRGKMRFDNGDVRISISGEVSDTDALVAGSVAKLSFGDAEIAMTLDSHMRGKSANGSLKFGPKTRKRFFKSTIHGPLLNQLVNNGIQASTPTSKMNLPVRFSIGSVTFVANVAVDYVQQSAHISVIRKLAQ